MNSNKTQDYYCHFSRYYAFFIQFFKSIKSSKNGQTNYIIGSKNGQINEISVVKTDKM